MSLEASASTTIVTERVQQLQITGSKRSCTDPMDVENAGHEEENAKRGAKVNNEDGQRFLSALTHLTADDNLRKLHDLEGELETVETADVDGSMSVFAMLSVNNLDDPKNATLWICNRISSLTQLISTETVCSYVVCKYPLPTFDPNGENLMQNADMPHTEATFNDFLDSDLMQIAQQAEALFSGISQSEVMHMAPKDRTVNIRSVKNRLWNSVATSQKSILLQGKLVERTAVAKFLAVSRYCTINPTVVSVIESYKETMKSAKLMNPKPPFPSEYF